MKTFLQYVSDQLLDRSLRGSDKIIFPNKRSASLCKRTYVEKNTKTTFLPHFITIEDLVCELSGLDLADPLALKFILYKHYRNIYQGNETVDQVFSWANQLINDFSEIDRNLIDEKDILGYLRAIKEIEHWSKTDQPTDMIKNYLWFWDNLPKLYGSLKKELLQNDIAYQGLAYRSAVDHLVRNIDHFKSNFYFVGFNALNKAEEKIFQTILEKDKGEVFWDIDEYFLERNHNASHFLRGYQQEWKVLQNDQHKIRPSTRSFKNEKEFYVYNSQGDIQQAISVGEILNGLNDNEIRDTAILLGDESILESLMFSIPEKVKHINITMGLSVSKTSIGSFFLNYIKLCKADTRSFFYKDILLLLESGILFHLFNEDCKKVRDLISKNQLFFLDLEDVQDIIKTTSYGFKEVINMLISNMPNEAKLLNEKNDLVSTLLISNTRSPFITTLIKKAQSAFQKISSYLNDHEFEIGLNGYLNLYQEVISKEQIDLRGEKDKGLQIMGLLESRCLDFNNVIITSVNEGILPQGKTSSSFIPFDLKKQYQLPTYQEKDKVYSYHFFRVLQRAENIHLLYNDLSGNLSFSEESRFIKILEEDRSEKHQFRRFNVELGVQPNVKTDSVPNSTDIQKALEYWMTQSGVSASALISYIRDPYDLYKKKVLHINDPDELKDLESADLFGNVVHDSLEELYKNLPFHQVITVADIKELSTKYEKIIKDKILEHCGARAFDKGSNILGFEAVKKQIDLLLNEEMKLVEDNELQILAIEESKTFKLENPIFDKPILLNGKIDRIDQLNGMKRIIDYKTGASKSLSVDYFSDLITDESRSHVFQTLFYSLLKKELFNKDEEWQAGNIYLKEKDKRFKPSKIDGYDRIDHSKLSDYQSELQQLLLEIYDIEIPFNNKEAES